MVRRVRGEPGGGGGGAEDIESAGAAPTDHRDGASDGQKARRRAIARLAALLRRRGVRLAALLLAAVAGLAALGTLALKHASIEAPLLLRAAPTGAGSRAGGHAGACGTDEGSGLDAAAYICTGKGCDVELLCVSVLSLRGVGEWAGPVYVVTDRPDDVGSACTGLAVEPVLVPPVRIAMQFKNMKRTLLDTLPRKPKRVVYIDADVVAVGPIREFLEGVRDALGPAPPLAFFHDNYCFNCNTYNGGFMLHSDTPGTRQCLEAWTLESSADDFKKYVKDQNALDSILKQGSCWGAKMLPGTYVVYVDSWLWPGRLRLLLSKAVFQHFTTGIRDGDHWDAVFTSMQHQLSPFRGTAEANARRSSTCLAEFDADAAQ